MLAVYQQQHAHALVTIVGSHTRVSKIMSQESKKHYGKLISNTRRRLCGPGAVYKKGLSMHNQFISQQMHA